jgi:hypothetical protein
MRNLSDKSCRENWNTLFTFNFFSWRPCCLRGNVEKYGRAEQATHRWQYNTARALCMLSNKGFGPTLRMCNTYCISTATMVTRTRFSDALYVRCLSCFDVSRRVVNLERILLQLTCFTGFDIVLPSFCNRNYCSVTDLRPGPHTAFCVRFTIFVFWCC